ncbi:MAG: BTAD domain-containing putative transcriptional regulator [Thermodesulfobacteriota bacterium]
MQHPEPTALPPCLAKGMKPVNHAILHRERLYRILDKTRKKPFTWLAAPPGAGKTSLVSGYVESRDLHCIWYHLDDADSDPVTFFFCMTEIACKKNPEFDTSWPRFGMENFEDMTLYAKRYFDAFFFRMPSGSVLVLDNYQEVLPESEFHHLMKACLKVIPEDIRILILSRDVPPAPLAAARAGDDLEIVDWRSIRFTRDETDEFLKLMGLEKSFEDLSRLLYEKTGGWIAGLMLMVKRSDIREIDAGSLDRFTPLEVFDYFAGEMFEKTDAGIQRFLMVSAIFWFMTVEMTTELTGNNDSENILEFLHRRQFFLERRIGDNLTYHYHQLFREFLLYKAEHLIEERELKEYKLKAARILETRGFVESAFGLYQELHDAGEMSRIVLDRASQLLFQNRHKTLEKWISSIPEQIGKTDPWLLYWEGMCFLPFRTPESKPLFEKALNLFESRSDPVGILLSLSGLISCSIFMSLSFRVLDPLIEGIIREKPGMDRLSDEQKVIVVVSMLNALSFRNPSHPDYLYWKEMGEKILTWDVPLDLKVQVAGFLMWNAQSAGNLAEAFYYIQEYGSKITPENITPLTFTVFENVSLYQSWLAADFNRSRIHYNRILSTARETGVKHMMFFAMAHLTAAELSLGNLSRADDMIRQMEALSDKSGVWGLALYFVVRAWAALLKNDGPGAEFYAEKALRNVFKAGSVQQYAPTFLGRSIVCHMQGARAEAENFLIKAMDYCRKVPAYQTEFACRLVRAEFSFEENDKEATAGFLQQALSLGRKFGYMNVFFWDPRRMAKLCAVALDFDVEPDYVRSLIRQRELKPPGSDPPEKWPWPLRIYTLGRFAIFRYDEGITFKGKVQKRPLHLLQALVITGGREVPETRLQDELWPDLDGDDAHNAFNMALHRLRKLLGVKGALQLAGGKLSIDLTIVWIDVFVLKELLEKIENICRKGDAGRAAVLLESAFDLYKGPFLAGDIDSQGVSFQENMEQAFLRAVFLTGDLLEKKGRWRKAESIFRRGVEIDPVNEDFHKQIMHCCEKEGRFMEAVSVFKGYKKKLSALSGLEPGHEIKSFYQYILRKLQ